jgi:transcriptional regulator with XRE-family HTH domain
MVHDVSDDSTFADDMDRRLMQREIVKHLVALRSMKELSQGDIAKHLNCTQSRISKLESGTDDELSIGDLARYLDALGLSMRLVVTKKHCTAADEVKHHAFSIKRIMDELANLAVDDAPAARSVLNFMGEAAWNITRLLRESAGILNLPESRCPRIAVDVEEGPGVADDEFCEHCGGASP